MSRLVLAAAITAVFVLVLWLTRPSPVPSYEAAGGGCYPNMTEVPGDATVCRYACPADRSVRCVNGEYEAPPYPRYFYDPGTKRCVMRQACDTDGAAFDTLEQCLAPSCGSQPKCLERRMVQPKPGFVGGAIRCVKYASPPKCLEWIKFPTRTLCAQWGPAPAT